MCLKTCVQLVPQFVGNHWIMGTTGIMCTPLLPEQPQSLSEDEVICYAYRCYGYNLESGCGRAFNVKWRMAGACPGCELRKAVSRSCREARRWRPCQAGVLLGPPQPGLRSLRDRPTQAWVHRTEPRHPPASTTPLDPARPLIAWPTLATLQPPGPPQLVWATTKSNGPSAREISPLSNLPHTSLPKQR